MEMKHTHSRARKFLHRANTAYDVTPSYRSEIRERCFSCLLSEMNRGERTYRANLEGSPVRHVHPVGILRPSCSSRRFPRLGSSPCLGVSTTSSEGLDREGESHLQPRITFGAGSEQARWEKGKVKSSFENHCRVERIDLEESARPASLSSLWFLTISTIRFRTMIAAEVREINLILPWTFWTSCPLLKFSFQAVGVYIEI